MRTDRRPPNERSGQLVEAALTVCRATSLVVDPARFAADPRPIARAACSRPTSSRRSTCRRSPTRRWTGTPSPRPTPRPRGASLSGGAHPGRPRRASLSIAGHAAPIMTGAADTRRAPTRSSRSSASIPRVSRPKARTPSSRSLRARRAGHVRPRRRQRRRPRAPSSSSRHAPDRRALGCARRGGTDAGRGRRAARASCWCRPEKSWRRPAPCSSPARSTTRTASRWPPRLVDVRRRRRRRAGLRRRGRPARGRRPGTRADVDLVVTTGGVSAGAYEVVRDAFDGARASCSAPWRCSRAGRRAGAPSTSAATGCRSSASPGTRSVRSSRSRRSCDPCCSASRARVCPVGAGRRPDGRGRRLARRQAPAASRRARRRRACPRRRRPRARTCSRRTPRPPCSSTCPSGSPGSTRATRS